MLKQLTLGLVVSLFSVSIVDLSEADKTKHLAQPKYETVDVRKRGSQGTKSNIRPKAAKSKGDEATMDPLPASMDPLPGLKTPKKKFE